MADATPQGATSNRYQVLGRLAGGGMADIYLARSISEGGIERHVVLKRVVAERARDPHVMKMFLDEARLAVQLDHPNIAQVYDFGKLGGSYFFTMEYIHGVDLRALRRRLKQIDRLLPVNLALHIATNVLGGLHHAHELTGAKGKLGVVHRDVSPSNVMVGFDGAVKLLDFGVAKATQQSTESRTGVKGKIAYLSPEQCRGRSLDRRSDLFSMGIVMYEMLTGKRLYKRESDFEAMAAIVTEDPTQPSKIRPELSADIDRIVLKALSKDPSQRYETASEMAEDIETVAVREYHRISQMLMGKFMREVYGDRPEPWAELSYTDMKPFTVTSSILIEDDAPRAVGSADPITHDSFEVQLDRAPVWRSDLDSPHSGPIESKGPHPRLPTADLRAAIKGDEDALPTAEVPRVEAPKLPSILPSVHETATVKAPPVDLAGDVSTVRVERVDLSTGPAPTVKAPVVAPPAKPVAKAKPEPVKDPAKEPTQEAPTTVTTMMIDESDRIDDDDAVTDAAEAPTTITPPLDIEHERSNIAATPPMIPTPPPPSMTPTSPAIPGSVRLASNDDQRDAPNTSIATSPFVAVTRVDPPSPAPSSMPPLRAKAIELWNWARPRPYVIAGAIAVFLVIVILLARAC